MTKVKYLFKSCQSQHKYSREISSNSFPRCIYVIIIIMHKEYEGDVDHSLGVAREPYVAVLPRVIFNMGGVLRMLAYSLPYAL